MNLRLMCYVFSCDEWTVDIRVKFFIILNTNLYHYITNLNIRQIIFYFLKICRFSNCLNLHLYFICRFTQLMVTHFEQFSWEQSERKNLLEKLNEIRTLTENLQTQQILIENQIFEERKQACFVVLNCTKCYWYYFKWQLCYAYYYTRAHSNC